MDSMQYEDVVRFHGHSCPGLAMGYRMALAALEELKALRSEDEEVVAITENDACGVDALQCLTGCTFGKGNLVFRDFGKQVYTLFSRATGQGVRVLFHGEGVREGMRENRAEYVDFILNARPEEILSLSNVTVDAPEPARVRNSVFCDGCSEQVMESRTREIKGRRLCIPCAGGGE